MSKELIEQMVRDGVVTKESLARLVRKRPPLKINLANMVSEHVVEEETVQKYIAKKIRDGKFGFLRLEEIEREGISVEPIVKMVADILHIKYVDMDNIEVDIKLFGKISYSQLMRYKAVPIEETDLYVLVAFQDPLDMGAQDAIQRLFGAKTYQYSSCKFPKKVLKILSTVWRLPKIGPRGMLTRIWTKI